MAGDVSIITDTFTFQITLSWAVKWNRHNSQFYKYTIMAGVVPLNIDTFVSINIDTFTFQIRLS